jgi:hypothetical protein
MESPFEEGMIFDSSLLSSSSQISLPEYKEKLISLLKPILLRRFPSEYAKQKIRPYRDRISCSCPYCGDSAKNPSKKRGNFILEGKHKNFYKCFNCGTFKRVDNFFKDYGAELDLSVVSYIVDTMGDFSSRTRAKYDSSIIMDTEEVESFGIDREEFKAKLKLIEVKGSDAESWLRRRLQFRNENFLYNPLKNYIAILNLTPSGKILGIQTRKMGKIKWGKEKYLTYNLSKLYKGFKPNEEVPDEMDSLSLLFGIFDLNFSLPVTLFEGAFDSYLYKNSIALAGAHKALPFDINVRNWFDYDETGREKSIRYIQENQFVFLWGKLQRDFDIPYREKWDLNDLLLWFKEKEIKVPRFDDYFSDDPLDIIDI